jgi:hypothetical protein
MQVWHDLARIYDLPSGQFAVVLYANLMVKNNTMISQSRLIVPCNDFPLELDDPGATPYYDEMTRGSPYRPLTILNNWLIGELSLSRRQREGVIVATVGSPLPSKWHDETLVSVNLFVREEQDELCFEFKARVDRSLKRMLERKCKERNKALLLKGRTGLFGGKTPEHDRHMNERLQQLNVPRGGGGVHETDDPGGAEARQTGKRSSTFEGQQQ